MIDYRTFAPCYRLVEFSSISCALEDKVINDRGQHNFYESKAFDYTYSSSGGVNLSSRF